MCLNAKEGDLAYNGNFMSFFFDKPREQDIDLNYMNDRVEVSPTLFKNNNRVIKIMINRKKETIVEYMYLASNY